MSYRTGPVIFLLALGGVIGAGCDAPYQPPPQKTIFGDTGGTNVASISGAAWDPEAYWYLSAMCGQDCPIPPLTMPGIPLFDGSVVSGAVVSLLDPVAGQMVGGVMSGPTAADGVWILQDAPSRLGPPYFTFTVHDPDSMGGGTALQQAPPLPPVPASSYLPTLSLRPIYTNYTNCYGQTAELISKAGILEAVAKHKGLAQVEDLLSGSQYGGVVVWWMYMPLGAVVKVPAFATTMQADVGEVLNINWAPPGVLPPEAGQSTRGFYVDVGAPVSGIGLTVTLLPPGTPPTIVQFTAVDPVSDGDRPWVFPELPPMPIVPGFVSFGQVPGIDLKSPPPPPWACLH